MIEFTTKLYSHQVKAVEKLKKIKVGALYMEMGTGKTRTALELIKIRLEKGRINHVLWLCPCSVKESLKRDIIKHLNNFDDSIFTICGIETLSSSINVNTSLLELVKTKNCMLIVDESNMVKNHKAKRTKNIIRLGEDCKYKLILNGTPISRNEADLYSQWYILDWRILGYKSFWSFSANHIEYDENTGRIRRCLNVKYLTEKIGPYSYQVKKDECLDLPPKTYETEYYYLTHEQIVHYDNVADELMFEVDEMEPHTIYRLFTYLQDVISGYKVNIEKEEQIEKYRDINDEIITKKRTKIKNITKNNFFNDDIDNPRIKKLLEITDKLDIKAIIFCKYTSEIDSIVKILNLRYGDDSAVSFNGELNNKKRQENLYKFENKSQFLVANKQCGAYGLNLQFCSYVIYYSNDWDLATRSQSEDRVHRIGQVNNVHYVDICAAYTLDERILKCLERKEKLVDSFKDELDKAKDKQELFDWISVKNNKRKKTIGIDKSNLMEE